MYVIKVKGKNLFYNRRNDYGFHDNINKADVYNSKKGASNALSGLKYWWTLGEKDKDWKRDYHAYIKDFQKDLEIREVKIELV